MFWKKKKDKVKSDGQFEISFDADRRHFYRVEPARGAPLFFLIGRAKNPIIDISAGGFAMAPGKFAPNQRISGVLLMPGGEPPIPAIAHVVKLLPGKMVACEISKIKAEDRERLHQYVLKRQKEELELQRKREKKTAPQDKGKV